MKFGLLISTLLLTFSAHAKLSDLEKNSLAFLKLMSDHEISSIVCHTQDELAGKYPKIEIKMSPSDVDNTGITISSDYFYYGTNEIWDLAMGKTVLISFGEEGNYTLLLDTGYLDEKTIMAKLIDEEAEDGHYVKMECFLK